MKSRSRQILYILISALISAFILIYLFQHITLNQVVSIISDADKGGIMMFLVFSFGMSFFRTWRYLLLLSASGFSPPKVALFLVVIVRNLFSDLLPARIGTLIYVALVSTRLGVAVDAALSSWAYSLVFDLIAIAPLIIIASIPLGLGIAGEEVFSFWILLFAGIFLLIVFLSLVKYLPQCFGLLEFALRKIKGSMQEQQPIAGLSYTLQLANKLSATRQEIEKTQKCGILGQVLVLSVLVRLCKYAGLYAFLYALLLPMGFGFKELDPLKSFLGICAAELSASLPISGIAGFGLYQGTWSLVFEVLLLPGELAKLTSISHHLFTQAYGYSIGVVALILLVLPIFRIKDSRVTEVNSVERNSAGLFFAKVTAALLLLGLGLSAVYGVSYFEKKAAPVNHVSSTASEVEQVALRNLAQELSGQIVFDSNRSGSFGIYAMHLDSTEIRALIDGPKHEMYPDPSSDGRFITYAISPSLQRIAPSKVYVYDIMRKKSKLITEDGNYPSFSFNGEYIYFARDRKKLYRHRLMDGREELLFPLQERTLGGYQLVQPRVSANGEKVCFTSDKSGTWNVWCANLKQQTLDHIGDGCQPNWSGGTKIVWVGTAAAKERSAIMQSAIEQKKHRVIIDKDAPWGHEYFPSMLDSESHLLYSACPPGQHSHTDSNYQLFALNLATDSVVRLTFDSFTNRWPSFLKVPPT